MPETQQIEYLTTLEAATMTGLSPAWFERGRWDGTGPPYIKVGKAVRYPLQDLHSWMRARLRKSTADETGKQGPGLPHPPAEG